MLAHDEAVDYFSLHKRKKKDVDVEMLDYEYVAKCEDVDLLKNILVVLQSGKEGRYPQLEAAVEARLLEALPQGEKNRILRMKARPSESDVHAEASSLASWEAEISKKNEEIETIRARVGRQIPPPRGATNPVVPSVSLGSNLAVQQNPKEKKTINAYDWRAWEKFDVDAAVREVDEEDQRRKEEARRVKLELQERAAKKRISDAAMPPSVDVNAMSKAVRDVCAMQEKLKGNESFRIGDNEDALLFYSRSLVYDPTSAIVFANRALVHLKLKNFSSAEQDCSAAIECDATYFKAWSRRGMTRFRRGNYKEAIKDFEEALKLEPSNREIEKLLSKTKEKWIEVEGEALQEAQQESKPFQRFEIIEESDDDDDDDDGHVSQEYQSNASKATPSTEKPFQRFEIIEDDDE